ncbi:type VI secretion system-associated protein TagF [Mesorhizobium atlanticum]|uniref:Type VI secretion system-associated protein TagF n=1 Tax=Mesorhizobium atlanticum TaxID=2233532 RepID=A0A330GL83_9HYPH|nr:type VI secretion system-associated protein TagF [Mesorhizobium atlanticum]RAZ71675.1 type VI secretion system-associated protein TagF [Mesorhizobium atlanticum]
MPTADLNIGFFGKIPATGDFVSANLPRTFIDRWDRWMSMELRARPDEGELDPRAWRFVVEAGVFGPEPCAGVWCMSEDRVGRRYPFAIVRLGPLLDPADPWFDATAKIVRSAVEELRSSGWIGAQITALPQPESLESRHRIAFWLDDWEVQELSFSDIHDLAANGLPAMRAARGDPEVQ